MNFHDVRSLEEIRIAEERQSERWESARRIELGNTMELVNSMHDEDARTLLARLLHIDTHPLVRHGKNEAINKVIDWERSQGNDTAGLQ